MRYYFIKEVITEENFVVTVEKMVLDEAAVHGHDIFRMREFPNTIMLSEPVRKAIEGFVFPEMP